MPIPWRSVDAVKKSEALTRQGVRNLSPKQVNTRSNEPPPCLPNDHKYNRDKVCVLCGKIEPEQ